MLRISISAAFLGAAISLFAARGGRESAMESPGSDQQELEAVEREFPDAVLRGDAAFLARYTAEDFRGIDAGGREVTRSDLVARLQDPNVRIQSLRHDDIRVRVFGDCAVATARTVLQAKHGDRDVSGVFPYLRVWLRRGGRWQAVAAMSSSLPKESAGAR